jgi:hypothetical protein
LSQQYDLPLISMDKLLEDFDINKVDVKHETILYLGNKRIIVRPWIAI